MTPQDVLASVDVLNDVDEDTDSMTIEDAVAMREAVITLVSAARMTLALLDTQLVTTLEGPREINGMRYEIKKSDGKWRPDHLPVDAAVTRESVINTETGEIVLDPYEVAERAIATMADLYRSASTMPKTGALDKLGLKKWDVAEQEPGKPVLKTTPIVEAP